MKSNKNVLIGLGVFLIFVQLLGFIGMSRVDVGLFPSSDTLFSVNSSSKDSELNVKMVFFALEAGADRYASSIEDLTYSEDAYRIPTATQYASATIRESLGCSDGGSFDLFIYDTVLTISYCFIGILGVGLFFIAKIVDRRYWKAYWDKKLKEEQNEDNTN